MKDNKDILSEAFFKKKTYAEKRAAQMPQYAPVDPKMPTSLKGAETINPFIVKDTDEVRKRLAGTVGVAFGNNSIRSMASKAIKTFPILVSDNVEPETVVMLKRLMEEQYAEYINLLVSNQVIDLSDYSTGDEEGNIAIRALDVLSGTDFSSTRIPDKGANTGKITVDDLLKNTALATMLLREDNFKINFSDSVLDSLFENAMIVNNDLEAKQICRLINENASEIAELEEAVVEPSTRDKADVINARDVKSKYVSLDTYLSELINSDEKLKERHKEIIDNINIKDSAFRRLSGVIGKDSEGKDMYNKLTNLRVVVNQDNMDELLDKTVSEILMDPKNKIIKDRFEKATFLLECRRISGLEYVNYVSIRLGLPISQKIREDLILKVRPKDIIGLDSYTINNKGKFVSISTEDAKRIASNRRLIDSIEKSSAAILKTKLKSVLIGSVLLSAPVGIGAASGAIAGSSITIPSLGLAAALASLPPVLIGVLAGGVVGASAAAIYTIKKAIDRRQVKKIERKRFETESGRIEGWERVEALIDAMDKQRADIVLKYDEKATDPNTNNELQSVLSDKPKFEPIAYSVINGRDTKKSDENEERPLNSKEIDEQLQRIKKSLANLARKSGVVNEAIDYDFKPYFMENADSITLGLQEAFNTLNNDDDFIMGALSEDFTTTTPMKITYVDRKPDKDVIITPSYAARQSLAYGSAEYDKKAQKDRRYDQPLIITIKFNERFSDGRLSDNELTAVIGILGKVIRVPSEEMKYILEANSEGETLKGIFAGGDLKNSVADLLSTSKISKAAKALPQSGDIWKNLEKVATLAAVNKFVGKKSNNIANAHIVFSQKEIDEVRSDTGIDYMRNMKLCASLMKRYSAFTLMIANDPGQKLYICDDLDAISWNLIPYTAIMNKDTGDQLTAALSRMGNIGR